MYQLSDLEALKRAELVKIAKSMGIKANGKVRGRGSAEDLALLLLLLSSRLGITLTLWSLQLIFAYLPRPWT